MYFDVINFCMPKFSRLKYGTKQMLLDCSALNAYFLVKRNRNSISNVADSSADYNLIAD